MLMKIKKFLNFLKTFLFSIFYFLISIIRSNAFLIQRNLSGCLHHLKWLYFNKYFSWQPILGNSLNSIDAFLCWLNLVSSIFFIFYLWLMYNTFHFLTYSIMFNFFVGWPRTCKYLGVCTTVILPVTNQMCTFSQTQNSEDWKLIHCKLFLDNCFCFCFCSSLFLFWQNLFEILSF